MPPQNKKYVTCEDFERFRNNDFRHLKWELHGLYVIGSGIIVFLWKIFDVLMSHIGK